MTSKHGVIEDIRHRTAAASSELEHRGMHMTASAVKTLGSSVAAIGGAVHAPWHTHVGSMHGVLGGHATHGHTKKRASSGRKKPRTAAQKRATAKMLAANRRKHGGGHKRKKHAGGGHKKRRTPAQRAATAKMLAANKRRGGHKRRASKKGRRRK